MKRSLLFVALSAMLASCYNDKYDKLYPATPGTATCDTATITYSHDIASIINTSCATSGGCHNEAGNASTGNLDFTVFATLQSQATPDILLNDIYFTPTRGHHSMPQDLPQLSACDQKKITKWVHDGAPNN